MRCADFYKRWERDPNWCEKTPGAVSQINSYLELVTELEQRGIDRAIIYTKMPEGSARPLFSMAPDTRVKVLNFVCAALGRSERIYPTEIKNLANQYEGKSKPEKFTNVNERTPDHEVKTQNIEVKTLAEQMKQVNPGAQVTINPIVINDTYRQSPFKTAAEVLAHDQDPLGVNAVFTKSEQPTQETPSVPVKDLREIRVFYAEKLLECYSERTQLAVKDLMREHTSWKTPADVFYFGIEALSERKR